jgi:hypothetical protein
MSDLRPQVRTAIQNFLTSQEDHQLPSDILRVIQEEATLLKETEDVRGTLTSDPYEQFEQVSSKALERFKRLLRVTMCERTRGGADFARTHAVVAWPTSNNMELTFLYERVPRRGFPPGENGEYPCQISYTIELAFNHGQRQRLLEVQVWAASSSPSPEPAVCIQNDFDEDGDQDDDEDGWEDIDDDEAANDQIVPTNGKEDTDKTCDNVEGPCSPEVLQAKKKQKTSGNVDDSGTTDEEDKTNDQDMDRRDQYVSFLDPDVLQSFLESTGLLPMTDGTAFFLLMTFPFFEHEWDIVGFVLDQVFGGDSDDEEEE